MVAQCLTAFITATCSKGHSVTLLMHHANSHCILLLLLLLQVLAQSVTHELVFTAGVFVSVLESSPDVLVWQRDERLCIGGTLYRRLKGHTTQVNIMLLKLQLPAVD
jgi:hypothetical protein